MEQHEAARYLVKPSIEEGGTVISGHNRILEAELSAQRNALSQGRFIYVVDAKAGAAVSSGVPMRPKQHRAFHTLLVGALTEAATAAGMGGVLRDDEKDGAAYALEGVVNALARRFSFSEAELSLLKRAAYVEGRPHDLPGCK